MGGFQKSLCVLFFLGMRKRTEVDAYLVGLRDDLGPQSKPKQEVADPGDDDDLDIILRGKNKKKQRGSAAVAGVCFW
jgi:hypothetical protein